MADVEAATQSYLRSMKIQDPLRRCVGDLSEINYEGSFYFPALSVSIKLILLQGSPMPLRASSQTEFMNSKLESLPNGFPHRYVYGAKRQYCKVPGRYWNFSASNSRLSVLAVWGNKEAVVYLRNGQRKNSFGFTCD